MTRGRRTRFVDRAMLLRKAAILSQRGRALNQIARVVPIERELQRVVRTAGTSGAGTGA